MSANLFTDEFDNPIPQEGNLPFREDIIFPVLPADNFLSTLKRQNITGSIKSLVNLPSEEHYEILYQQLLENFASFVQILPVNNEAKLSTLLDEGLLRGLFVLQVMQQEQEQRALEDEENEADPMATYVAFSAALLFDIARVIEDKTVVISDEDGAFVRIWNPYIEGPMPLEDGYFRVRRGGGINPWSSRRSVIAFATKVMPIIGLNWIYQNTYFYNIWIALLTDDREGAGSFRLYFDRAQELLNDFKQKEEFQKTADDAKEIKAKENELAERFLRWLQAQAKKGKLSGNKPKADVIGKKGKPIVATTRVIQRFVRATSPAKPKMAAVKAQVKAVVKSLAKATGQKPIKVAVKSKAPAKPSVVARTLFATPKAKAAPPPKAVAAPKGAPPKKAFTIVEMMNNGVPLVGGVVTEKMFDIINAGARFLLEYRIAEITLPPAPPAAGAAPASFPSPVVSGK